MSVGWNQGFPFDKHALSRVHRAIHCSGESKTISQWKEDLPMGPNAVEGNISYLKHLKIYDTKERKLTPLGELIAENDPGWRSEGTLFLLYFNISTNTNATAWHYMSNIFMPRNRSFTKKEAKKSIRRHVASKGISENNAVKDVNIYLRSVTEGRAFGDIKVIRKREIKGKTEYTRRSANNIPTLVLAYCLYKQRKDILGGDNSVELKRLLSQNRGVGKVFNLYDSKNEFLRMVDDLSHKSIASYTKTANLNDLEFIEDIESPISFASEYYSEI